MKGKLINGILTVLIIVLGYFGYQLYDENNTKIEKIIIVQDSVNKKINQIDTLQEEVVNISKTVDSLKEN